MLSSIALKSIFERRRSLFWWSIGFIVLVALLMPFYPALQDAPGIEDLVDQYPQEVLAFVSGDVTDFTTAEGYLESQLYFLMLPIMFIIYAVAFGSGAIAKEEEDKTLDLLLSYPIPRAVVVVEKFFAMVITSLGLGAVLYLSLIVSIVLIDMEINLIYLAETTVNVVLLGIAYGALALFIGCATGNRGFSVGITSAYAIFAYVQNSLGIAVESLKPLRPFSLFYYFLESDPLTDGLNYWHPLVYVTTAIILVVLSMIAFERRDLGRS